MTIEAAMESFPRIISVDDHIVEPPDLWYDRLPAKYRDIGPRVERIRGVLTGSVAGGVGITESDEDGARWCVGLPSIHSGAWDPFFEACNDTDTVINMHIMGTERFLRPAHLREGPRPPEQLHPGPRLGLHLRRRRWSQSARPDR